MENDLPIVGNATASRGLLNTSYQLASRFLAIPSRVLARMRQLDEILDQDSLAKHDSGANNGHASTNNADNITRIQRLRAEQQLPQMPGPWGFLTSGYFVGLFVMAFVLNRIQNIVVPPRHPLLYRMQAARRSRRYTLTSYVLGSMFPIDLSSTFSRFVFRIPSIYLLGKALTLWLVVLLQTAHYYPSRDTGWTQQIGAWALEKTMDDICWFTFTSVCSALFVGALTSGMEGLNSSNNAPFNLFAYSFVLYLYTSPTMHIGKPQGDGPSRPDKQVIVTIILPLLQLAMTHCMEVKQKWARLRLIPTTLVGLLSLIHFHSVLWLFPSTYPLPNYIPNIVESFLLVITLITISLNAVTQLLLTGSISKPLFGHQASLKPKWDEDFTVVLFRLGTASLEATSVAGFGNEVGGVSASSTSRTMDDQGMVELNRSGVVSVSPRKAKHGFANEITKVKSSGTPAEFWVDSVVNVAWRREMAGFGRAVWSVARGVWCLARGKCSRNTEVRDESERVEDDGDGEEDVYEKFLRGEYLEDEDEDEEFQVDVSSDDDVIEEESDGDGEETVGLYADLTHAVSTSANAPLLLAHMTDTSSSPLTRRRYSRLVSGSSSRRRGETESNPEETLEEYIRERRETKLTERGGWRGNDEDESRRSCVVCTVEQREIICWPCRCLALCDDCRENLASRSSASKHICPCCRRNVEGYSKIYIP